MLDLELIIESISNSPSLTISIIALLISALGFLQSRRALNRDKAELKVHARIIAEFPPTRSDSFVGENPEGVSAALMVTVTNIGRRQSRLRYVCGRRWGASPLCYYQFVFRDKALFDQVLNEADEVEAYFPLTKELLSSIQRMICLYAVDSSGKKFKLQKKMFKQLLTNASQATPLVGDVAWQPLWILRRPIYAYPFDQWQGVEWYPSLGKHNKPLEPTSAMLIRDASKSAVGRGGSE